VLLYAEVGMDHMGVQLASQRLAAVQCNYWGHSDTGGCPTLDYYLSSDLMEPPDGDQHYTEKVVRLPNLSLYYEPVETEPVTVTRADLGLRDSAVVYWSAQSLHKYLPHRDQVFPRIARDVGDCQFTFVGHNGAARVTELFWQRLERAFAAYGLKAADHCVMLPQLKMSRFIAAIGQADVFLDSLDWSGCNTALESLPHHLPIVTMTGGLMRGRHCTAFLQRMGVTETITTTVDDYVAAAVRIGRDRDWRMAVKARMAENEHRIYRDRACIAAMGDFLDRVARNPAG
jgi:predicted O-linked N-acetylglucosamine transferase (SPINDLY family)